MSNGNAALQLVHSETLPVQPAAPELPGSCGETIEQKIGRSVADTARALCLAELQIQNGGLSPAVRAAGAMRIYNLYSLRRGMPVDEFTGIARQQGLLQLQQGLIDDPEFGTPHATRADVIDFIQSVIAEILVTLGKIAEFEKRLVN